MPSLFFFFFFRGIVVQYIFYFLKKKVACQSLLKYVPSLASYICIDITLRSLFILCHTNFSSLDALAEIKWIAYLMIRHVYQKYLVNSPAPDLDEIPFIYSISIRYD